MGYEKPIAVINGLNLDRDDQEKILGGNAKRLLRIK
jgi:predicted TIM-barrel fold metal-dependent hydrolase